MRTLVVPESAPTKILASTPSSSTSIETTALSVWMSQTTSPASNCSPSACNRIFWFQITKFQQQKVKNRLLYRPLKTPNCNVQQMIPDMDWWMEDACTLKKLALHMTKQFKIAKKNWKTMEEAYCTSRTVLLNRRELWIWHMNVGILGDGVGSE